MANYLVSYDLNGPTPTPAQMDQHFKKLGECTLRVLETVWYVQYDGGEGALYSYANQLLSNNDRILIISAQHCTWRNLLVTEKALNDCWS